jgi:phosphate transport system substrate-binding protein
MARQGNLLIGLVTFLQGGRSTGINWRREWAYLAAIRQPFLAIWLSLALLLGACSQATPAASGSDPKQPAVAGPASDLKGTISVSGAFALYPMMQVWAEEFTKVHPQVQFDISAGGAGKGMTDALSGAVDIGMVSRDITADEEAKGAFWIGVTKDAVFGTINEKNPALPDLLSKGISREVLAGIFISGDIKTWGQVVGRPEISDEIHVYTRSDSCGAAETWAKYLGDLKQEDLLGIGVSGDPGEVEAIVKDPLGIGYNNLNYVYDASTQKPVAGAVVVPIDANENGQADEDEVLETKSEAVQMVATGKYPSPPARVLNLVTQGKPGGLVQAFLAWILTDGQKFADQTGYIQLPQDLLDTYLKKIQ